MDKKIIDYLEELIELRNELDIETDDVEDFLETMKKPPRRKTSPKRKTSPRKSASSSYR